MSEKVFVYVDKSDISELLIKKQYVYGLTELGALLGVCPLTAGKIARERLDGCYFKSGKRKLVFESQKVIERLKEKEA